MNFQEFINNLQSLNPSIKIIADLEKDKQSEIRTIYCDSLISELVLPDDFVTDGEIIFNRFYTNDNLTLLKIKLEPLENNNVAKLKENLIIKDLENDVENIKGWAVLCGLYASFAILIYFLMMNENNKQFDNETLFSNPQFISVSGNISLLFTLKNILSYYEKLKKLDRLKNSNSKYANTTKDLIRLSRKYMITKKEKK